MAANDILTLTGNGLVGRIKEIVAAGYSGSISCEDIAAQIFISSSYATRLFRKHTGDSINAYITRVRMNAALDILRDPTVSIGEVAARTGYNNIAYFSSVFRKTFDCTPREWRDSHALPPERELP